MWWVLSLFAAMGLAAELAMRYSVRGWLVGLVALSGVFVANAVTTGRWWAITGAFIMAWAYAHAFKRWRANEAKRDADASDSSAPETITRES